MAIALAPPTTARRVIDDVDRAAVTFIEPDLLAMQIGKR
jgi:hypothetical protein